MPPMTCFTEADEDRFLDHVESPFHRGKLQAPAVSSTICNPYCGDEVTLQLVIQDQRITEAWFYGDGCAVSQAAASMLCECINGQDLVIAKAIGPEQVLAMLGTEVTPLRQRCALLAYQTLAVLLKV